MQAELFGGGPLGGQAPQVNGQAARGGHGQPAPGALAGGLAQSLHGRVGGLPAQQAPHHLNEQVTHHRVAAAVDAAFAPTAIALVDALAQPGVAGDLAAVVKALESPGFPTGG